MIRNEYNRLEMHPKPPVHKARLAVVGDTVSMSELKAGKYFQSDGGDLLRQVLTKYGVDLEQVYFTVSYPYIRSSKQKPLPEEITKQRQRLVQELQESECEVVMLLGANAVTTLVGEKATMSKMLGQTFEIAELPNVPILCNYHPANMFHNSGNYKAFAQIMQTAAGLLQGYKKDPGKTKYDIYETREKLEQLYSQLKELPKDSLVTVDIETSSLVTWKARIWVIGITWKKNYTAVIPMEVVEENSELVDRVLGLPNLKYTYHNGKYDMSVLDYKGYDLARADHDTMYMHYTLDESSPHGLGYLATMYLGADEYKSEMNSEFSHITDEAAYWAYREKLAERVAIDTDYTWQIANILLPMVEKNEDHKEVYYNLMLPYSSFLLKVQRRGLKLDVAHYERLQRMFTKEVEDITNAVVTAAAPYWDPELYKMQTGAKTAGADFKPTSVKQMKWMVYTRLKLRPTLRGGGTGEDVLLSIENPPEFITKVLDLRKAKKKLSTFVTGYLEKMDDNNIVHSTFNCHTTATGRLSSTEPNVQQLPSDTPMIRRGIIPRGPNRVILEIDYSGAELRVLAAVSGDANLQKAILEGDMHSEVAEMIFGPSFTKLQRGIAKTVNFGIIYGRGAGDLHNAFPEYSVAECQGWIDSWAKLYPDAWKYLQESANKTLAGEDLVTPYKRHRRFGLVCTYAAKSLSNESKNYPIQSTSSDNTMCAAMKSDDYLVDRDTYIINLIHDSILIDAPADEAIVKDVMSYLKNNMLQQPKLVGLEIPFHVDIDLGKSWGDTMFASLDLDTMMVHYKTGTFDFDKIKINNAEEHDAPFSQWVEEGMPCVSY